MAIHRIYIDEVGNHDMTHLEDGRYRFLSLTGVIVEAEYHDNVIAVEMETFKRNTLPLPTPAPIILHRKDIRYQRGAFACLQDPERRKRFDAELLKCLSRWQYTVITVVIDKEAHRSKYKVWQAHPYHYCLEVLLERYVLFLKRHRGDVLAESRGKDADMRLSNSYVGLYGRGTKHVKPSEWQARLTSRNLKLKKKPENIAGLQLADLIAYPSQRGMLHKRNLVPAEAKRVFGDDIWEILCRSKYHRNRRTGKVEGYGKKFLP